MRSRPLKTAADVRRHEARLASAPPAKPGACRDCGGSLGHPWGHWCAVLKSDRTGAVVAVGSVPAVLAAARLLTLALVVALVAACSSAEPVPMPLVATYELRFAHDVGPATRAAVGKGAAEWTRTGAIELTIGPDWETLPSSAPDSQVFVGWLSPDAPELRGEPTAGYGFTRPVRFAGLVFGEAYGDRVPRIAAHELGHAMGLGHVDEGVMAPTYGRAEDTPTCEDWAAFCGVHSCPSEPCAR